MNLFVLDLDPYEAARQNNDKHCVKIILEANQCLSTTLDYFGVKNVPMRPTHKNHPINRWIRESRANYDWTCKHLDGLLNEYTLRYNKVHACQKYLNYFKMHRNCIPDGPETERPLCMPDQYKVPGDPVKSYRNYYICEKAGFAKWKNANVPDWWPYNA